MCLPPVKLMIRRLQTEKEKLLAAKFISHTLGMRQERGKEPDAPFIVIHIDLCTFLALCSLLTSVGRLSDATSGALKLELAFPN